MQDASRASSSSFFCIMAIADLTLTLTFMSIQVRHCVQAIYRNVLNDLCEVWRQTALRSRNLWHAILTFDMTCDLFRKKWACIRKFILRAFDRRLSRFSTALRSGDNQVGASAARSAGYPSGARINIKSKILTNITQYALGTFICWQGP